MSEADNSLQAGIAAYRAGEREKARVHLLKAIREQPNSEQAWGWLSNTTVNADERMHCLRQVVRINPGNAAAEKLLNELEGNDWLTAAPPVELPGNVVDLPTLSERTSTDKPLTEQREWYRDPLVKVLTLLFFTPLWVLIMVTDPQESQINKMGAVGLQMFLCIIAYFYLLNA